MRCMREQCMRPVSVCTFSAGCGACGTYELAKGAHALVGCLRLQKQLHKRLRVPV